MNGCTTHNCEVCGLVDLMGRTAVPDVVFTGNTVIVEALKRACILLHSRMGVKVAEWKAAQHGWVAGFNSNGRHYLAFAIYGEEHARVFESQGLVGTGQPGELTLTGPAIGESPTMIPAPAIFLPEDVILGGGPSLKSDSGNDSQK